MWPLIVLLFISNIFAFQQQTDDIYTGCGTERTCFGIPDNCVEQHGCAAIITVVVLHGRYLFELKSGANNVAYVSIGLSSDDLMGNDAVMECIRDGNNVRAYSSWNTRRSNTRQGVPQNIITLINSSFVDGTIYCKLEREPFTTILEKEFDLVNTKFHLMVAIGNSVNVASIGMHNLGRIASSEPVYLSEVSIVQGRSNILFRLHGALMLAAWIGAASVGILLARFFKQTWVESSLCGKDQWFAWHRVLMITTWLLTLVAFVIIFVEVRGWSSEDNPHAILGTITTILCFIQPFMALFRPGPTHKNRPIFNWAHWSVGNVAYVLAIVTIFFAVPLSAAQLPQWYDWILVAFVVFHILMHFILTIIAGCASDESNKQSVITFPATEVSPRNSIKELVVSPRNSIKTPDVTHINSIDESKKDAPYTGLRKGLLAIYLMIVLTFVIALVVISVLAPIGNVI